MTVSPHRFPDAHAAARSVSGHLVGLGVFVFVVGWACLSGCSQTPQMGRYGFDVTRSDLLHEVEDRLLDTPVVDVDLLDVPSAGAFGFLEHNPAVVSVDGIAVRMAGHLPPAVQGPWIQIMDGKVRLSGPVQDPMPVALATNPTP